MKTSLLKFFIFAVGVYYGLSMFLTQSAAAASTDNVYGWMWSSNIGWISLNNCTSSNPSSCSGAAYGVSFDTTTPGTGSGYAWSSNIGWISFEDTSCPETGCTPGSKINWNTGNIEGWARACSVYVSGCSGLLKSIQDRGGWEGYIKLGPGFGGKVNSDNSLTGYAWGSEVIGWVEWKNASVGSGMQFTANVNGGCVSALGSQPSLSWATQGAQSCSLIKGIGSSPSETAPLSAAGFSPSNPAMAVNSNPTQYKVQCVNGTQTITSPLYSVNVCATVPGYTLQVTPISSPFVLNGTLVESLFTARIIPSGSFSENVTLTYTILDPIPNTTAPTGYLAPTTGVVSGGSGNQTFKVYLPQADHDANPGKVWRIKVDAVSTSGITRTSTVTVTSKRKPIFIEL